MSSEIDFSDDVAVANTITDLGYGARNGGFYGVRSPLDPAPVFLKDWRLTGMLMDECQELYGFDSWQPHPDDHELPLRRAILNQCVRRLLA